MARPSVDGIAGLLLTSDHVGFQLPALAVVAVVPMVGANVSGLPVMSSHAGAGASGASAFSRAAIRAPWSAAGIDPTAGAVGQTARLSSQSVPGGSVSYQGVLGAAELGTAATSLCDEAYTILYNAGLMRAQVTIL